MRPGQVTPGGDNLVKGVQCYELFGGIALKIHTFSFFFSFWSSAANQQVWSYQYFFILLLAKEYSHQTLNTQTM